MAKGKYQEWLTEDGLLRLEGWARDGLSDEQISHNIGINPATLYKWINEYDEIGKAIKKGKAPVDLEVENALMKRALGYEYTERHVKREIVGYKMEGGKKVPIFGKHTYEEVTTKQVPPDTTAQIFWLKNRRPDKWRDKREETIKLGEVDPETLREIERIFNDETAGG